MFKKFSQDEISGSSQAKSSAQRKIKAKILDSYPMLTDEIDMLFPKKIPLFVFKCKENYVSVVAVEGEPLFWNIRDEEYYPTLRTLHKYPDILPKVQVDKGAIKYVMGGAHVMCPGLTSPGAAMDTPVEADKCVAIHAEGKELALGIGMTKMSTAEIKSVNKGVALNNFTYLNDGLWKTKRLDN